MTTTDRGATTITFPALLMLLGILAAPLAARAQDRSWTVRGTAVWVSPAGDDLLGVLATGAPFRFAVDGGAGLGFELEHRLGPRFGIELAALASDLDVELAIPPGGAVRADAATSAFELWSAGLNYHLAPGRRGDYYAGLFVAMTALDDIVSRSTGQVEKLVFDDDVGFGLKLGLDHPFGAGDRWTLSIGVRYLAAILEGEVAGQDGDLDPLILSVGVGYRF